MFSYKKGKYKHYVTFGKLLDPTHDSTLYDKSISTNSFAVDKKMDTDLPSP